MGGKPLTLGTWHKVTGELMGEDRVSNTLDSALRALDERDELLRREDAEDHPLRRAVGHHVARDRSPVLPVAVVADQHPHDACSSSSAH